MEGAYKSRENFNEFSYLVEKIFKFYIRKSQWKIDFLTVFSPIF